MKKIFPVILLIIFSGSVLKNISDEITDITVSPIDTFKKSCSRCHGYEGSAYGKGFAAMEDSALKHIVQEMMVGPAQLKPSPADVGAMNAYHKALRDKKPFAIVLNAASFREGKDKKLIISASPGAIIKNDKDEVEIRKVSDKWEVSYDPESITTINIIVERDSTSSVFSFPVKLWND